MSGHPQAIHGFVRRHFSTLFVVALVVIVLAAVNLFLERSNNVLKWYFGWPLFAYRSRNHGSPGVILSGLIFDLLACTTLTAFTAVLCEWLKLFRQTLHRPLFQFSVRAVVCGSIVAGFLLFENLTPNSVIYRTVGSYSEEISIEAANALIKDGSIDSVSSHRHYGWPYEYAKYTEYGTVEQHKFRATEGSLDWIYPFDHGAAQRNFTYDVFLWFSLILFTVAWMSPSGSPVPNRSWLNLHLSSALVLANIIGLCYVENVTTYLAQVPYNGLLTNGWPLHAIVYRENPVLIEYEISYIALIADLFAGLALATGAAYANEFLLRRRQVRNSET